MRALASKIAINSLSLFLVSLLFSGLQISGGFTNFLIAGALLALFSTLLDPVVRIITLPFNLLTLGFLSFLTTLVALFFLGMFFPAVSVQAFTFDGFSAFGISIGKVHFSLLLSFIVVSATIYIVNRGFGYLFDTR